MFGVASCSEEPIVETDGSMVVSEVVAENGVSLNGVSLNGVSLNGVSLNGTSVSNTVNDKISSAAVTCTTSWTNALTRTEVQ
jgi:hypothetical protein